MEKMKLFENGEDESKVEAGKVQVKAASDTPETGSPDSQIDPSDLFGEYSSLVFLSGTGTGNTVKLGDRLNMLEINKKMMDTFDSIEFEDFQWICKTEDFLKYLEKTGRNPKTWSTNENEKEKTGESSFSKVLNFDEYRGESGQLLREEVLSYSEYKENILQEDTLRDILMPGMTEKGMKYKKKDPDFKGGALTDDQRKYLRFYYTKNIFMHGDLKKDFSEELDLETLKKDELIQIFTAYIDEKNEITEESIISFAFRVTQVIKPSDKVKKCLVIGHIINIAPKIPGGEVTGSPIEKLVGGFEWAMSSLYDLFSTSTGTLFAVIGGLSAVFTILPAVGMVVLGGRVMAYLRGTTATLSGIQGSIEAAQLGRRARAVHSARLAQAAKKIGIFKTITGSIGRFVIYPAKILVRIGGLATGMKLTKDGKRISGIIKGTKTIKGVGRMRYVLFGVKGARAVRAGGMLTTAFKVSNPLGWVLLLGDLIGSSINYTSDNQAPSWNPIIGDKTDAMINYAGASGPCPSATNSVTFKDLEKGEQYTMCWTQGPDSGFGVALSFVMSVSTRTTIDMIKLDDWQFGDKDLSVFIITNVNHKETWDKMKDFDLKLLIFKGKETYEEGVIDDNISAKWVVANQATDPKDLLPMAYMGHTDGALFGNVYMNAPDQLVTLDPNGPEEFIFNFEDSESNIINVWGKKITEEDLQNASEEEVQSFFNREPVSTYIGDPNKETEEEKIEREEIEKEATKAKEEEQKELEKGEEESPQIVKSGEKTNESILSFDDFKRQKEGNFVYEGTAIQDLKSNAGNTPNENFQRILKYSTSPAPFEIYFVTLREYADPSLRATYQPGSFMNFLLTPEAISAADGADISADVSISNYDILLNCKKGLYTFDQEASDREKEEEAEAEAEKLKGGKSQIEIKKSGIGGIINLSRTPEKEKEEKKQELEREGGMMAKVDQKDVQSLDIEGWGDITNVKAIKDKDGNITKVKIKNRKASLDDKSRTLQKGDPGFESAVRVYDKYKETENPTTPPNPGNVALGKENTVKIGRT